MLSPARRHMLRQSAVEAAQRENNPLRHATGYELMLLKLNEDKRTLKKVRSLEKKAEIKRRLLPDYAPWVNGVLSEGRGAQDAILMTVMIWRLDAGDIPGALAIARYALRFGLAPPDNYKRNSTAYLLAEDVADAAMRAWVAKETVDPAPLLATLELTRAEDMPDQVRAKLHKVIGYVLREAGRALEALEHLKRALQLHDRCGVVKDIERLARELRNQAGA
ncbi:MAG: terminase endonuclease subunit [Rouxiella aceris]|uniref:phage terminase small subunit n=1 Tax=Rouxiella aceris TaxID=2703884 RepID=UPI00284FFBBD|nr:terminase endonuclease subunit [Rouxiella aceris]MDR3432069.1 terminase endonuclease subunit [Rouxiella aceris]